MTKKQLIESLADFPDDKEIHCALGNFDDTDTLMVSTDLDQVYDLNKCVALYFKARPDICKAVIEKFSIVSGGVTLSTRKAKSSKEDLYN